MEPRQVLFPNVHLIDFQKASIIATITLGVFGLLAGGYYFWKRIQVESDRITADQVRQAVRMLLEHFDEYDQTVLIRT